MLGKLLNISGLDNIVVKTISKLSESLCLPKRFLEKIYAFCNKYQLKEGEDIILNSAESYRQAWRVEESIALAEKAMPSNKALSFLEFSVKNYALGGGSQDKAVSLAKKIGFVDGLIKIILDNKYTHSHFAESSHTGSLYPPTAAELLDGYSDRTSLANYFVKEGLAEEAIKGFEKRNEFAYAQSVARAAGLSEKVRELDAILIAQLESRSEQLKKFTEEYEQEKARDAQFIKDELSKVAYYPTPGACSDYHGYKRTYEDMLVDGDCG